MLNYPQVWKNKTPIIPCHGIASEPDVSQQHRLISVEPGGAAPFPITPSLRLQIQTFVEQKSAADDQRLAANEYEINLADIKRWSDDGMIWMQSPLGEHAAGVELSFEQIELCDWLLQNNVKRLKIETA